MADPQSPSRLYTSEEFAGTIRKMYPELGDEPDDHKLTHAILQVHPEFKDSVVDVLEGSEHASTPASYLKRQGLPPPPSPFSMPGTQQPSGLVDNRKLRGKAAEPPPRVGSQGSQDPISASGAEHIGVPPVRSLIENRISDVEEKIGPLGSTLLTPIHGAVQAATGLGKLLGIATDPVQVSKIATNPFDAIQDVADVVSGGLKVGSVLLPEAAMAAPLETITGLLAGGATQEIVKAGLEKLGAHPAVVQLASDLAAIVAGGATSHETGKPARLEQDFAAADTNAEVGFRKAKETESDQQALARAENFATQQREIKKLHDQLNINAGLDAWAKAHKTSSTFSALDAVGSVGKPPPAALPPSRVVGELPPARPIIGAPSDLPIESVGDDAPLVSQPSRIQQANPEARKQQQNQAFQAEQRLRLRQGLDENASLEAQAQAQAQTPGQPPPSSIQEDPKQLSAAPRYVELTADGQPIDPLLQASIDSYARVPPVVAEPPPQPRQLAERAGPAGVETRPAIVGAASDAQIETVGSKPPVVAQTSRPFPEMIQTIGEQLSNTLREQPQNQPPRPSPEMRGKLRERAEYKSAYQQSLTDLTSQMEDIRYQPGKTVSDTTSSSGGSQYYSPPAAGSEVYWRIVGKDSKNPPSRDYITAIMQAYRDTEAMSGKDLPAMGDEKAGDISPMNKLMAGLNVTTESGARRAYDQWIKQIKGIVDSHARSRMDYYANQANQGTTPETLGSTGVEGTAEISSTVATRPPAALGGGLESSPDLPGFVTEPPQPGDDLILGGHDEEIGAPPPTVRDSAQPTQPSLWDRTISRAKNQEGHLILDVTPGDHPGLKRWLQRNEKEYGDQEWHQAATDALIMGEPATAWKIAQIAAARSFAASSGGVIAKNKEAESIPDAYRVLEQKKAELVQIQKEIGETLPHGTTIDHGIVKLPGNPGGLDPKVTDLTLGRLFAKSLVDLTDPTTIVRIVDTEGKTPSDLPKSLQIANQMADQYLRETPEDLLEPLMEDLGISRSQLAGHFARKISDAGRSLGLIGNWVQANEEAFIHLDPDLPSTKGPGAAGRLEFIPEDRAEVIANYMDILRRKGLTPKLLENMEKHGYEHPKGVDPASKAGQQAARGWLRNRQKQITAGKLVDQVARKYNDTDTIMAALGEVPPVGKALEDASQFSLATMLAQMSTTMNVFSGQAIRYGLGSVEEAMAGVSARLKGDLTGSTQHFTQALQLAKTPFNQLDYLPKGMLHSPTSENLETIFEYTRTADPKSVHKYLQALEKFPQERGRLQGMRLEGDTEGGDHTLTTGQRIRNLLTVGIRAQEMPMRVVVGDSVLRSLIAAKGDDPLSVLGDPSGLIGKYGEAESRNMIGASVSQALNYTFAGNPLPDSPVGKVLQLMREVPGLAPAIRTARPFVRFTMATTPRFIWDRMAGLTLPVDLAMHHIWKTGRLSRGLQLDALQRSGGILDATQTNLASANFRVSDTLNDSMTAMLEARQAKKGLDALNKRGESTGALPDVQDQLDSLKATYDHAVETANQKRAEHLAARQEATDLTTTYEKSLTRSNQLREIDAPNWDQYISRQTTGALMMTVAFGLRAMNSQDGDKYYQFRPTKDGDPIDLRSIVPGFGVYLHTADFFQDIIQHTDLAALKAGKPMSEAYTGKYRAAETLAGAMDDWFNVSYLTGVPGIVSDLLTGKTPEALGENAPQSFRDLAFQWLGEQLGRFTTGLETVKDLAGTVRPEEALRRTPERAGPDTPLWRILFGPALSHVPGASEILPERISPFTGRPIAKEHPGVHQATGLSFGQPLTLAEEEINRTGLAYGHAVPKVTGDQDLDNAVNRAFASIVQKYLPAVVGSKEYKGRSPELNRDVLESVFHEFRSAAYGTVISTLGDAETDQTTAKKLTQSPGMAAKIARWKTHLEQLMKEEPQGGEESDPVVPSELPPSERPSAVDVGSPPPRP